MDCQGKRINVSFWGIGNQKGFYKCHNGLQTCVNYKTVKNWRKDEKSRMEEDCDWDGDDKSINKCGYGKMKLMEPRT